MVDLDDLALLQRHDPGSMAERIAEIPESVEKAWQAAQQLRLPADFKSVQSVLITGMGGSAIGGDLVRSLAEAESPLPVAVSRGYELPAFAQRDTLVVAISHSGATEETLTQVEQALSRGCKLLAVTSGEKLRRIAEGAGGTVFAFDYLAQPRAAIAYLFAPLVALFGQLGLLRDHSADMDEAVKVMRELKPRLQPETRTTDNLAKQLAHAAAWRVPVIYGGGMMAEVAHRWKTQFNENSKAWAAYDVFPELNHNAVVGYEHPKTFLDHVLVLLLETSHEHARVALREEVTRQLLDMKGVAYQRIAPVGQSALAQMLAGVMLGDYVSYYLAHLYQADPTPVEAIDHLKQELARAAA